MWVRTGPNFCGDGVRNLRVVSNFSDFLNFLEEVPVLVPTAERYASTCLLKTDYNTILAQEPLFAENISLYTRIFFTSIVVHDRNEVQ